MKRTVRFAADVQVHVIDGEENRRGVWEQYARDRERFQRRIQAFESAFQSALLVCIDDHISPVHVYSPAVVNVCKRV